MLVSEIQLYEALSEHLGKEKAKTITEYIEAKVEKQLNDKTTVLATKADLANTKVDLIKWMVGFWLVQMAAIIGLYLKA